MITHSEFIHHYTVSPYRYKEPLSADWSVKTGGEDIPVYTCRISAYPFNRVWTGFQRPVAQTEKASFINIVTDEPSVSLEIRTSLPHDRLILKPVSRGISPIENKEDGVISVSVPSEGKYVLEADSYHHCLYIFVSKPYTAENHGKITHYFGPGIHMPGKIELNSHDTVYIDRDALVFGCFYAENKEDIHIFGNGLIDDSSEERFCQHCYEPYTTGNLKFYDCKNVTVEGILCRNSAIWCVNLFNCEDCTVKDVKIFGQWRYNTDGVDIVNSRRIKILDSFIHSFDDTVTIKGIDRYCDSNNEDILTEGCVLWCDWGKTCEVGIETDCREYKNIIFRDCDILRAGNTVCDIANGDCAEIHDILFENIRAEFNSFDTPEVYQSSDEMEYGAEDRLSVPAAVRIHNWRFRNPVNSAAWDIPETMWGVPDLSGINQGCVHDVAVRGLKIYFDRCLPREVLEEEPKIEISSCLAGVEFYNIEIAPIETEIFG